MSDNAAGNNAPRNVSNVIKTLWNLERELRSAAQNGLLLRTEDARNHLAQARQDFGRLLGRSDATSQMPGRIDSR